MKSLDYYYVSSILLILLCTSLFTYQKFSPILPNITQILIIGCNVQAAALSNRLQSQSVNVTIIEQGDCGRDVTFTFIHDSPFAQKLVDSINFRYQRVPEEIGFWDGKDLLRQRETSKYASILEYGLSEWALNYVEKAFRMRMHTLNSTKYDSIEQLFQLLETSPKDKSLEFLLYDLGLDKEYVRAVVYPYLYGNYLHQMELNLLATKLKLLQLFNTHYEVIGTQSDMIFRLAQKANILQGQTIKQIKSFTNPQNQTSKPKTLYTITTTRNNFTNISCVILCNTSKDLKESYYHTQIFGSVNPSFYSTSQPLPQAIYSPDNLGLLRQFYTKRRKNQQLQKKKYIALSKRSLSDKDLKMFNQYEITNSTKRRMNKFLQPELGRLSDGNGVFYMNYVFTVSDSRELSLSVVENVARLVREYLIRV